VPSVFTFLSEEIALAHSRLRIVFAISLGSFLSIACKHDIPEPAPTPSIGPSAQDAALRRALFAISLDSILSIARKHEVPDLGNDSVPTNHHPPKVDGKVLNDTIGLTAFLDSLQADLDQGSMRLLLSRLDDQFHGDDRFVCEPQACVLKTDTAFARGTAQELAWYLKLGGMTVLWGNPGPMVVGPTPSISRFESIRDSDYRSLKNSTADPSDKKWPVPDSTLDLFVGNPNQALLDKVNGNSIGTIGAISARKIEERGGFEPKGYEGRIGVEWLKIQTPDGRIGWTSGKQIRDTKLDWPIIRLVHLSIGWRIFAMGSWVEEQNDE
jgi:hypothetical protein